MIDFKYIDSLPDALTELYAQVETDILNDMAERINAMDFFNTSVQWQEQKLQQMGLSHNLIVRKLSQLTGKTETELTKLINNAGAQVLASNAWLADAGYNLASVSASEKWKARLSAGLKKTSLLFTNLTQTTAYATDSAFGQALDRAYMQIESGAFSRTEAVRNAVKDLSAKGLRTVMYANDGIIHTDNVDVAVRRAVLTGVNQTTAELQLTVNEELGLDLVEVSAHAGARPSHAEWQGRIYSLSGKSAKYPDFRSATGYGTGAGLCGWNCRHTFYPWAEGSSRVWSDQALAKLEDATVEYNGGKYTEYEASQYQRSLERAIRKYKREASALAHAQKPNAKELEMLSKYEYKLNDFCEQTGFKKQYDRTYVVSGQISKTPPATAPAQKVAPKATQPQKAVASVVEERKYKLLPDSLKPENLREGLRDTMTAYLKTLEDAYDNAPEEFRKVWENYIPSSGLIAESDAKGAYFSPSTGKVYYSWRDDSNNPRGNGVTYFHEHGHALDWKAGQASLRDEFKKALQADYKSARERVSVNGDKKADQDFKLSMELYKKPNTYNGVSDTFDGLSKGKARGKWGHPSSYWKRDSNNAYAEAWAHMTEAVFFEGQRTAMTEYFPTAWEVFNDIIKTL